MLNAVIDPLRRVRDHVSLPRAARAELRREKQLHADPGIDESVRAALDWLGVAQDSSRSADGGFARHFSLVTGWAPSYPETTGYIIPTLLRSDPAAPTTHDRARAVRALDWLASIQLPGGGFQGGMIGQTPVVPVTFNTGQILIGLAAGTASVGNQYRSAMEQAAEWLAATQDGDGAWRRHPTPFAEGGEKAYETHVAWGLLEAARVADSARFADAGLRNIAWALTKQRPNGWFADCCLTDPARPLTHTIGYALRGVIEGYLFSGDSRLLDASLRTANGLLSTLAHDGTLAGRLDSEWRPAVQWVCLTGSVQVAHCWLLLHRITGDARFLRAACSTNSYVRQRVRVDGPPNTRGAVKGSFPASGDYGRFEYLNWACKFFIDSNLLEREIRGTA